MCTQMIMHLVSLGERLLVASTILPQAIVIGLNVTIEQRLKGATVPFWSHTYLSATNVFALDMIDKAIKCVEFF